MSWFGGGWETEGLKLQEVVPYIMTQEGSWHLSDSTTAFIPVGCFPDLLLPGEPSLL